MSDSKPTRQGKDQKIEASFVVTDGHLTAKSWTYTVRESSIHAEDLSIDERHQFGLLWLITGWKSGKELHRHHDKEVTKLFETLRHNPDWLKPLFGSWRDLSSAIGPTKAKSADFWKLSKIDVSFSFELDGNPESTERLFDWLDSKYLGEDHNAVKLEFLSRKRFGLGAGFSAEKMHLTGKAYALTIAMTLSRLLDVTMLGNNGKLHLMIKELEKEGDWEESALTETLAEVRLISYLVASTDVRICEILGFSVDPFERILVRFEKEITSIINGLHEHDLQAKDQGFGAPRPLNQTNRTNARRSLNRIRSDLENEIIKLTDKLERCSEVYRQMLRSV